MLFLTCILMLAGIQRTSAQVEDIVPIDSIAQLNEVPIDSITRLLDRIPVDSIDALKEEILSTFSDEKKEASVVIDSVMPKLQKKAKKDWSLITIKLEIGFSSRLSDDENHNSFLVVYDLAIR